MLAPSCMLATVLIFLVAPTRVLTRWTPESFEAVAVVRSQIGVRTTHAVVAETDETVNPNEGSPQAFLGLKCGAYNQIFPSEHY